MVVWPDRPLVLLRGDDVLPGLAEINLNLTVAQVFGWLPN